MNSTDALAKSKFSISTSSESDNLLVNILEWILDKDLDLSDSSLASDRSEQQETDSDEDNKEVENEDVTDLITVNKLDFHFLYLSFEVYNEDANHSHCISISTPPPELI